MTGTDQAIAAVVQRMEAIAAGLAPADGVARFNDLYLAVTRAVLAETRAGEFERPELLARLDVVFAGHCFAAVDAARPGHAWRPLFDARRSRRIAPLQFALAGMNAHINHDLALALVAVCASRASPGPRDAAPPRLPARRRAARPRRGQVKRRFYDELDRRGARARRRRRGDLGRRPRARRGVDHARTLWQLRDAPELRDPFLDTLARLVGLASRGLLLPTL